MTSNTMTAEAGPGPSTMNMNMDMTSSPLAPASVKKLRAKKRMINIVNPAGQSCLPAAGDIADDSDPESFSMDHNSQEDSHEEPIRRDREVTPLQDVALNTGTGTPLGSELAKRGILRPSGTPGSGNGGMLL